MPVSYVPSAEQLVDRQKTTAKKRRRNQNAEIDELSKLLPLPAPTTPLLGGVGPEIGEGSGNRAKSNSQAVDKISVLRITSTFLKFQEFLNGGYFSTAEGSRKRPNIPSLSSDLLAEAMDGFLIALDQNGTILYVSESITSYIGLTQHDVIGQSLDDITHPDDRDLIKDNLSPKATLPPGITNKGKDIQPRQFYIRFKSTMSPGRVQLSRFNSYTMIQVTGNLKVRDADPVDPSDPSSAEVRSKRKEVVGFIGECRLIESTASILEISIPQSYFTTTISMEMKIVSVESQMKELIGFSAEEFIGTRLRDYFHPADYKKLIPCEVMLMHTGHAVSPVFRFMSSSGGWVWMQMEGILRYKPGTKEKQFWEIKVKMVSQEEGNIALIEQNELYTPNPDPNQDLLNPHKDRTFLAKLSNSSNLCRGEGAEAIHRSLRKANLSGSLIDSVLHGREMGISDLPGDVRTVLRQNEADEFKVKLRKSLADGTWGQTDLHFDGFEKLVRSPPPDAPSPNPTVISTLSSTMTSDPSIISGQGPNMVGGGRTYFDMDAPILEGGVGSGGDAPIQYYCVPPGGAMPSPSSAHNSPAPPTLNVGSPAHSSLHGGYDVRSPLGSPASSSVLGVAGTASPAPSIVSSVHSSGQRSNSGQRSMMPQQPAMMPSVPNNSGWGYSFSPSQAITSTFGNMSTGSMPNFTTQTTPQATPLPNFSPTPCNSDLDQILNGLSSEPVQQQRNWNGTGQQQQHVDYDGIGQQKQGQWSGTGPAHWNGTGQQQHSGWNGMGQQDLIGDDPILTGLLSDEGAPYTMSGDITVSSSLAAGAGRVAGVKEGVAVVGVPHLEGSVPMDSFNPDQFDQVIAQLANS